MRKRKLLCLILALACITTSFVGCKGDKAKETASDVTISGLNEFPVVKEKIEFDVFAHKSSYVADFETNEFTKWYEDKTNVHLNWTTPSGDAQQAFNLMIASGEYPDFILGMGLSREQVMSLVKQGVLVDIKDEIEQHGYYIKKMFEEEPSTKKYVTIDGNIYGVPHASASFTTKYAYVMWAYKPWLEKLGLKVPETTEEFYQMLKAFKEKDPNGNGKADEIPLAGRGVNNSGTGIAAYIMSAFIPSTDTSDFYEEDGEIKYTAIQPEYREGLRYLKKLYDEGLIYQDSFILDRNQLTAIGESETPILGAAPGGLPSYFTNPTGTTPRYYEFTPLPPLEGPDGVCGSIPRSNVVGGHSFMVTKECKYPDVAVKWVDWLLSYEGYQKSQDRGLTFIREAKEGELGLDGQQALWAVEQKSAEEQAKFSEATQNLSWFNCTIWYSTLENSIRVHDPSPKNELLYELYSMYEQKQAKPTPFITIAEEDADDYADYQMIDTEVEASFAKFITGELSIDKDWDKYIDGLNSLGLKKYIALMQRNYDAGNK